MSDDRLRELERRWKETGGDEQYAAYLLERVRAGELPRRNIELAAVCGSSAARTALGREAPEIPEALDEWAMALAAFDARELVRVLILVGHAYGTATENALQAAEEWYRCPCPEHASEAGDASSRAVLARDLVGELIAGCAYAAGALSTARIGTMRGIVQRLLQAGPSDEAERSGMWLRARTEAARSRTGVPPKPQGRIAVREATQGQYLSPNVSSWRGRLPARGLRVRPIVPRPRAEARSGSRTFQRLYPMS